jgi:CBS domain containing-hemolysin-like protein
LILKHILHIQPVAESELAHSEEELRLILAESGAARALSSRGTDISMRALGLRNRVVREVVTPRREVVFLDIDASFESNLRLAKSSRHTRFPLCREHLDNTLGLVHIKDLLTLQDEAVPQLDSIKRELLSVPEMMSLEVLLELFLTRHAHLALAVDEFGGATGIVTLDNVIEELVGEIQDEFDAENAPFHRAGPGEFTIKGRLSLHEARELTGLDFESEESSTVGGFVTEHLGHLPQAGETLKIDDYLVTILHMDGRRVREVRFQREEARPESSEQDGE